MNLPKNLHDWVRTKNNEYKITRVPGGWIYCREEPQVNLAMPVFVPDNLSLELIVIVQELLQLSKDLGVSDQNKTFIMGNTILNKAIEIRNENN